MCPRALSALQSQRLDRLAIEQFGIPSAVLMENAGRLSAECIWRFLKNQKNKRVCIFCGPGNNGGDGFVIARHLWQKNVHVHVFFVGNLAQIKGDALCNYRILRKLKHPVKRIIKVNSETLRVIEKSDLLVDAIFGIGLNRLVDAPYQQIIEALNKSKKKIVSIDVPSGLNATDGNILGISIRAHTTVTFATAKAGFFKKQGPGLCGNMVVADIGIPHQIQAKIR